LKPWRRIASRRVQRCGIFDLDRVDFEPPTGGPARPYYVIDAPEWINIIPLTDGGEILMLRQFRFGISDTTLEIPGGMCDPGESPDEAARRELREETGYAAEEWVDLGWVHPNPPIQNNRCHTFLARRLVLHGGPRPDADERFELVVVPREEVPSRIAGGEITHALVLAAFQLLDVRGQ
jgi:8-oxo-dGTP pyrophosphatase MutT (NUDIX family)